MWWFNALLFGILCLSLGSALAALTWRWPLAAQHAWRQEAHEILNLSFHETAPSTIGQSRSICPHCKHTLPLRAIIPLASFALCKGRCLFCQDKISNRYPTIELLTFALLFPLGWIISDVYDLLLYTVLFSTLIAASIIDAENQWLPDSTHFIALCSVTCLLDQPHNDVLLQVYGGLIGFALFALLRILFYRIRKIDALGIGDAKLLGVLLYWQGLQALPFILLAASLSGLVFALLRGKTYSTKIAFGPFLVAASLLYFYLGTVS